MILYFSGTGNSEYTAKRIREETDDNIMNLGEKIRSRDFSGIHSDTPWVVAAPTYAWRIPRILQEWLEKTELTGNRTIYFVMTCGGNIGNAGRYLKKLTDAKGLNYAGCAQIIMPENYIAMFATPTQEEAAGIIRGSLRAIDEAARQIKDSRPFPQLPITRKDKINSSIVNILFYPMFVHAKKFQATSACTSCGKCVVICPLNNKRNPGLGKKLHPLHGLHKPLSKPSHRIRKTHPNPPPLHLPQKHIMKINQALFNPTRKRGSASGHEKE